MQARLPPCALPRYLGKLRVTVWTPPIPSLVRAYWGAWIAKRPTQMSERVSKQASGE